jgi:hypothetical protein
MDDKKWAHLGTFRAKNAFGRQKFLTEKSIVRYVRITVLSAYGKWSFFTLTQVAIRGKNLFADALTGKAKSALDALESGSADSEFEGGPEEDGVANSTCPNQLLFGHTEDPLEKNLIAFLITKIDKLEERNSGQSKRMEAVAARVRELNSLLLNKTEENGQYTLLLEAYQREARNSHYVVVVSVGLSVFTLCSLLCLCLVRRR